jgi:hypothetical protein
MATTPAQTFKRDKQQWVNKSIKTCVKWTLCYSQMPRTQSIRALKQNLFDDDSARTFLFEEEVFYTSLQCGACGSEMSSDHKRWTFRCRAKRCRKEISLMKHTFFYGTKLSSSSILHLAHLWLDRVLSVFAMGIIGHNSETVTAYYGHFRKLVASME